MARFWPILYSPCHNVDGVHGLELFSSKGKCGKKNYGLVLRFKMLLEEDKREYRPDQLNFLFPL